MLEPSVKLSAWLQSVLSRLPEAIRAIYVEYDDAAYNQSMEQQVCFNAFGYTALAEGRFDPANPDHVGELGEFTWEPPNDCIFRANDHPGIDWLAVLKTAAGSPDVVALALARSIQLIVGEHDCEVFVIV